MASRSETALKKAIEMEKEGRQFYLESASSVKSELARKVFEELAREEDCHISMIERIYKQINENGKPLDVWISFAGSPGGAEKVFRGSLKKRAEASDSDVNALRFGLEREEKSMLYYESLAEKTKNKFEKRFYLALSYEERGHYLKILDAIEFITDTSSWYYVNERGMVDGG